MQALDGDPVTEDQVANRQGGVCGGAAEDDDAAGAAAGDSEADDEGVLSD